MTGVNINSDNNSFSQQKQEDNKSSSSQNVVVVQNNMQVAKSSKPKQKTEPAVNNHFVMFTMQDKIIMDKMVAIKHKYNQFIIMSNTRLRSFKFDHIIKTESFQPAQSQNEESQQQVRPDNIDTYLSVEVDRFLHQNKNLIYVNMTDDCIERFPSQLPEFPKKFYDECKLQKEI